MTFVLAAIEPEAVSWLPALAALVAFLIIMLVAYFKIRPKLFNVSSRRQRKQQPIEKDARYYRLQAMGWAVAISYCIALFTSPRLPEPWKEVVFIGAHVVLLGLMTTLFVLRHRRLKRAVRNGLMVCPKCEYILRNLGRDTQCPECGQELQKRQIVQYWRQQSRQA